MDTTDEQKALAPLANRLMPAMVSLVSGCLPSPSLTLAQVQQFSPAALAYIGDAVYELYVRAWYLNPPRRIQTYHEQVVTQVRAEQQAAYLRSLESLLTSIELDVLRRGRNAAVRRLKRVDPEIYQQATSFETLIGYLFLTDPQRLMELFAHLPLESTPQPSL